MPHPAHDRERAALDGPGDVLGVEGPEVLDGATTANQQHDLDTRIVSDAVERLPGLDWPSDFKVGPANAKSVDARCLDM